MAEARPPLPAAASAAGTGRGLGAGTGRPASPGALALRRLLRDPVALAGIGLLLVVVLAALTASLVAPYDPVEMSPAERLRPPGPDHPAGTDQFGRDIWTRMLFGAGLTLQVGVVSVAIAALLGVSLGLVGGYFGGWADTAVSMLTDLLLAFPGILLALGIVAVLGPGLLNTMIAVGISSVPIYTRLVRASVLSVKETPYVEAARVVGARDAAIVGRHILPNVLAPIVVVSTVGVAGAILTGASLGFLGLGAQPPSPEWGAMLSTGRNFLQLAWWVATFPGLAIMVVVLAINAVGDSVRDALDPRLKL